MADHLRAVPCGERTCPRCGVLWEGDQRTRAVAAAARLHRTVALITVTAPGREYFTDKTAASHEQHKWEFWEWNRTARRRWAGLHREASGAARRTARARSCDWRVLFRSWEYQKRGLLHVHLVLPFDTPAEREATGRYVADLWYCARWWGFGFVLGGSRGDQPSWSRPPRIAPASDRRAAAYVAKYVSSMGGGKEGMRSVAQRTAKRGSVLYVSPTLTRLSGVTMGSLRERRAVVAQDPHARSSRHAWEVACQMRALRRGRPPFERESLRTIRRALWAHPGAPVVLARSGEVVCPTRAAMPPVVAASDLPERSGARGVVLSLASVRVGVPDEAGRWPGTTRLLAVEVV